LARRWIVEVVAVLYQIAIWVLAVEGIYLGTLLVSSLLVWFLIPETAEIDRDAAAKPATTATSGLRHGTVRSWVLRSGGRPASEAPVLHSRRAA
jgi:hypothetical protein